MSVMDSQIQKKSRLLQSQSDRLQREVDKFTHRLEQQRRRNVSLDDQVRLLSRQVKEKKQNLQAKLPSVKQQRRLQVKIRTLQNNFQKQIVKLNDIEAKNKELREIINVLRREKKAYLEMFEKMQQELIDKAQQAQECNKKHLDGAKAEQTYKLKMLEMKVKAQQDITKLQSRFSAMQSVIEQDRKKQNVVVKDVASTIMGQGPKGGRQDNVDPLSVLQTLYNKWEESCQERKKVVDQYHRKIKILTEAFGQIKQATGIDDIQEIVTTFIKSQDQHYTLYSYVNTLNTDLDFLQERNQYLTKHYEQLKNELDQEKSNSIAIASEYSSQMVELNNERISTHKKIQGLKQEIFEVQMPVQKMIKMFENAGFELEFNKKLTRDEDFQVNENNIEQYLGELEEYTTKLVTFLASHQGKQNAIISGVTIEDLPEREERKTQQDIQQQVMAIDNLLDEADMEDTHPLTLRDFNIKSKDLYNRHLVHQIPQQIQEIY